MVRYVIGDIHGRFACLTDVLNKVSFDPVCDTLISLGDVCDGGYRTKDCIDKLIEIDASLCLGNHDAWTLYWMNTGFELPVWVTQGGINTLRSYEFDMHSVPRCHIEYLENAEYYITDDKNNLFVHGGFNPSLELEHQDPYELMWDREIVNYARDSCIPGFNRVFIGHTSTMMYGVDKPILANNLVMLDTGAGCTGKLTIMNIDTLEWWQSSNQCIEQDRATAFNKKRKKSSG